MTLAGDGTATVSCAGSSGASPAIVWCRDESGTLVAGQAIAPGAKPTLAFVVPDGAKTLTGFAYAGPETGGVWASAPCAVPPPAVEIELSAVADAPPAAVAVAFEGLEDDAPSSR